VAQRTTVFLEVMLLDRKVTQLRAEPLVPGRQQGDWVHLRRETWRLQAVLSGLQGTSGEDQAAVGDVALSRGRGSCRNPGKCLKAQEKGLKNKRLQPQQLDSGREGEALKGLFS
jgi:hypothetical protein